MSETPFQLGDQGVVMGYENIKSFRDVKVVGTVTARGENCVRLSIKTRLPRGLFPPRFTREQWFYLDNRFYHVEKAVAL